MGAFRASIQTTLHRELIPVFQRIALIVIYSRSRIPPPLWDLNLGKLCYLVPVNRPPYPTSLNTHCEDPSMAYSSAIPRHRGQMDSDGGAAQIDGGAQDTEQLPAGEDDGG